MQMMDVKVVPFHSNVIAVSEYYKGLVFYELVCTSANCSYRPLTSIPPGSIFDENFSQISIMENRGLYEDQIMFLTRVDPP